MVARVEYPNWDLPNLDTRTLQDHGGHSTHQVSTETPPILRSQENIIELLPERRQISGNSNSSEETQSGLKALQSSSSRVNLFSVPTIARAPEEQKPKIRKPGIRTAFRAKSSVTTSLSRVSDNDLNFSAGGQGDGNEKSRNMEKFTEPLYSESAPDHEIYGEQSSKKTGFSKAGFKEFGRRVVSRLFVVGDSNDSLRGKMDRRLKGSASESQLPRFHAGAGQLSHGELNDDPRSNSGNLTPNLPKIESCPSVSPCIRRSVPTCEVFLPSNDVPPEHEEDDIISEGPSPNGFYDNTHAKIESTKSNHSTPEAPRSPSLRLPSTILPQIRGRSLSVSTMFFPCNDSSSPSSPGGSVVGSPRISPRNLEHSTDDHGRKLSLPVSHTEPDLSLSTRKRRKRGYSGPEPMSQSLAAALYSLGTDIKNASNLAADHVRRPSVGSAASPVSFRLASQGGQAVTIEHLRAAQQEESDFDPDTDCGLGRLINGSEVNEMQLRNMLSEWRAEFAARTKQDDGDDE